jgi:hypothetical protein
MISVATAPIVHHVIAIAFGGCKGVFVFFCFLFFLMHQKKKKKTSPKPPAESPPRAAAHGRDLISSCSPPAGATGCARCSRRCTRRPTPASWSLTRPMRIRSAPSGTGTTRSPARCRRSRASSSAQRRIWVCEKRGGMFGVWVPRNRRTLTPRNSQSENPILKNPCSRQHPDQPVRGLGAGAALGHGVHDGLGRDGRRCLQGRRSHHRGARRQGLSSRSMSTTCAQ